MHRSYLLLLACTTIGLIWPVRPVTAIAAAPRGVADTADLSDDEVAHRVRSILSNRCFACHGPDEAERQGGFRLDELESYVAPADSGLSPVVPRDPSQSELLRRIQSGEDSERMPPPEFGAHLTAEESLLIEQWIAQGARLPQHWSFVPPERPSIPASQLPAEHPLAAAWGVHPIDRFVLAQQLERGFHPSPMATPAELLRRLSLDLTGLPPTLEEVRAFEQDDAPEAYERQVDRLLASPAFGEHWARKWLDLARYADSAGYADDPQRTIWAYRDWVIDALNANVPLDQFTIEQIAGDLLPNPTEAQLTATAFHRNTLTNNEGGTNDEEFRNVAVVDRVNTTMAVWMGVTMACAQCHTHKYDPLTHAEYFQLFAIFNQSQDADRRDESPFIELFTEEQRRMQAEWQQRLQELEQSLDEPDEASRSQFAGWREQIAEPKWDALSMTGGVLADSQARIEAVDTGARVHFDGPPPAKGNYQLYFPIEAGGLPLTAVSLETIPREDLPGKGAGFGGGNFVLSNISAWLEPTTDTDATARGRYLRIALRGEARILSLAEVEVFADGRNIASLGTATQSSTSHGGEAARAIDGNTSGEYTKNSTTHSETQADPWWELDLGSAVSVQRIVLWNRTDNGLQSRLDGVTLSLLDDQRNVVYSETLDKAPQTSHTSAIAPRRPLELALAVADYEQPGFPASAAIDGDLQSGWAVGGRASESHRLTLVLKEPLRIEQPQRLVVELQHQSPHQQHLLGSFAMATSYSPVAADWVRLPRELQDLLRSTSPLSDAQEGELLSFFHGQLADSTRVAREESQRLRAQLDSLKPSTSVPVMRELPVDKQRQTFVQLRGNYKSLGDEVTQGTPAIFHELKDDGDGIVSRLDLAHWLVDERNPLTARVFVNRLWESLFGLGIVRTSEEFGSQGDPPTHPELLDWLAVEAMRSDWDTKLMLRLLVTSQTYRQTSMVSRELLDQDRENVWLARGPRVRLSAEMIRDQALSIAGLLSRHMHGPPVRPPQPNLGLTAAFGSKTDWQASEGEDRYRRGIYTTWRRSNPYPSMATFDAPSREVCTLRRDSTNTPLQALVTLNDPAFVEAAQALARRIVLFDPDSSVMEVDGRLRHAFELCTSRPPTEAEVVTLRDLLHDAQEQLRDDIEGARQLATDPLGALPDGADPLELASWTAVCNVLMNLDEVLMKR